MTTTRATAAVLEAIQALDNGGVEHGFTTIHGSGWQRAAIIFDVTLRELGFCWICFSVLEDRRFKECERCRDES